MIYSIGIFGLLAAKFSTGEAMMPGSSDHEDGRSVFKSFEDAQRACNTLNERELAKRKVKALSLNVTWVVVGIDASWELATCPFKHTRCEFDTALALKRDARIIELQQSMTFVHRADENTESVSQTGASRECEATCEQDGGDGCVSSGDRVPVAAD